MKNLFILQKRIILFTLYVFCAVSVYAQYEFSGVVRDEKSGKPIIGATIYVTDMNNMATQSGDKGVFNFTAIPFGKHTFMVNYIDFKSVNFTIDGPNGFDKELGKVSGTVYLSKKANKGKWWRDVTPNYSSATIGSFYDIGKFRSGLDYFTGTSSYNGSPVTKDYKKAFELLSESANQGNNISQYCIAQMYENGWGVTKDMEKAFSWYKRAAELGNVGAQVNLGYMYLMGEGTKQDYNLAFIWTKIAAGLGDTDGQRHLGALYAEGLGVEKDEKQAVYWFQKAADGGDEEAKEGLLYIAQNNMSGPQQDKETIIPSPTTSQSSQLKNSQQKTIKNTKRIALIIGNCDYATGRLANPTNDAIDLAKKLSSLGFETITRTNNNRGNMKSDVSSFCKKAVGYDAALFFYAGHALQDQGVNYLVPIGAQIESKADIEEECIKLNWILSKIEEAGVKTKIIILDACRDNPIANAWERGVTSEGLSAMNSVPEGTFLVFSAQAGKKAKDGVGQRNSPYTSALLSVLDIPMLPIHDLFRQVRSEVAKKTQNAQIPSQTDNLLGDFYFNTKQ